MAKFYVTLAHNASGKSSDYPFDTRELSDPEYFNNSLDTSKTLFMGIVIGGEWAAKGNPGIKPIVTEQGDAIQIISLDKKSLDKLFDEAEARKNEVTIANVYAK